MLNRIVYGINNGYISMFQSGEEDSMHMRIEEESDSPQDEPEKPSPTKVVMFDIVRYHAIHQYLQ